MTSGNGGARKTGRSLSPVPKGKSGSTGATRSLSPVRDGTAAKSAPKPVPPSIYDYGAVAVPEHEDDDGFYQAVVRCIPSEFVLIASQDDVSKAQEDYFAMEHFQLKPPDGKARWLNSELAGSVATCALLQLMQENPHAWVAQSQNDTTTKPYTTLEILQEIQQRIKTCSKQDANPTITASRPLGPPRFQEGTYAPYYIVPPQYVHGTRRALLIACVSGEGEKDLRGTINDIRNIHNFLITHCGFLPENVTLLQETAKVPDTQQPTKKNITAAFQQMVQDSRRGDVNFIQFSGHGNRSDTNLYILPSDYRQNGYIQDDRILKNLIKAMPAGVYTTFLCDCCYSGTIGDLPYILKPDSTEQEIEGDFDTTIAKQKHRPRPKPKVQQSIRMFYDTDTREETLAKEAKGGEEYQKLTQSRKQKTTWMLFEPHKLAGAAKKAKGAMKKGANSAIDGLDSVIDGAIEAAKRNAKSAKRAFRSVSPLRSKGKSPAPAPPSDHPRQSESSSFTTTTESRQNDRSHNPPTGIRSTTKETTSGKLDLEDIPAPRPKAKPATKAGKTHVRKIDPQTKGTDNKVSTAKRPPSNPTPHNATGAAGATATAKNAKSPKPETKSTRDASVKGAPIKPNKPTSRLPMASGEIDEEEEDREFERAIARAKNAKAASSRGRSTSRSQSPPSLNRGR